jgi:glucose/arabinose dehydrogenase
MKFRLIVGFFLGSLAFWLLLGSMQGASANPAVTWPEVDLVEVTGGLSRPVHVTHAGDGSGRLFIVEQDGSIRIYQGGGLLPNSFLNIAGRVRSPNDGSGGEEGLLSMAFPPGYGDTKNHFYVYYTNLDGNNQVSRFYVTGGNPNQASSSSEELIILFPHPIQTNHNGGQLFFGPDGYLYIGTGDGGGGGDPYDNAQDPDSLLGKLLRIDVEFDPPNPGQLTNPIYLPIVVGGSGNPLAYQIPADNPFIDTPGYRDEIWAIGLRNPWRFSFDRLTGDLYIGDVGQGTWEEVDYQSASSSGRENYGWDLYEGLVCQIANCSGITHTPPIHVYDHTFSNGSVTGGFVYRGSAFSSLQNIYYYADYRSGRVMALQRDGLSWANHDYGELEPNLNPSSFGEDQAGELYLTARGSGKLFRLIEAP